MDALPLSSIPSNVSSKFDKTSKCVGSGNTYILTPIASPKTTITPTIPSITFFMIPPHLLRICKRNISINTS